jgi:NAD(P)-dependent dehydrogenase (short-subunit alcohol dehydrogenase family)
MQENRLMAGRQVIVTGAGRGLGRGYARHLARAGADVLVNDIDEPAARSVARELARWGTRIAVDSNSVATWEGAEQVVETCLRELGGLSGLVNNAGIIHESKPWADDPVAVEQLIRVNMLGTIFTGMHAMRAMRSQGDGAIVNVTSGAQAGLPALGAYCASKGGTASLTYSWAIDGAAAGIRVNAVSPFAATRMNESGRFALKDRDSSEVQPENIAPVVTFLLSDLASAISGQVIRVVGRILTVMTHPGLAGAGAESGSWSVPAVAEAFAGPLRDLIQPVGIAHGGWFEPGAKTEAALMRSSPSP